LLAALGYGMRIQAEQLRNASVSARTQLESFESSVQAPLLLVEKVKEEDSRSGIWISKLWR